MGDNGGMPGIRELVAAEDEVHQNEVLVMEFGWKGCDLEVVISKLVVLSLSISSAPCMLHVYGLSAGYSGAVSHAAQFCTYIVHGNHECFRRFHIISYFKE